MKSIVCTLLLSMAMVGGAGTQSVDSFIMNKYDCVIDCCVAEEGGEIVVGLKTKPFFLHSDKTAFLASLKEELYGLGYSSQYISCDTRVYYVMKNKDVTFGDVKKMVLERSGSGTQ